MHTGCVTGIKKPLVESSEGTGWICTTLNEIIILYFSGSWKFNYSNQKTGIVDFIIITAVFLCNLFTLTWLSALPN